MPNVLRFIIFPVFENRIHELLVQHTPPYKNDPVEEFSIHLAVKSEHFISFGKAQIVIKSNRPLLRQKGIKLTRRPEYTLLKGKLKYASNWEVLIEALDDFVLKNFDN